MVGVVLAVTAGIVALMGLTGRITVPRTWMHTVAAGLPVAAISGAFFAAEGWNLALAIGMTLAVVLGMLASMVGPAELSSPTGHWVAQAWRLLSLLVVAVVLGSVVIRWGVTIIAPIPLLNPNGVALVLAVAAVAAAAGAAALRGLVSTGVVVMLVLFVLVLVVGVVAGTPSTLTAPLLAVSHAPSAWLLLLVPFILAATNPALRQIRATGASIVPGTIVLGVVMLLGLVALLAFNGGYITLPSFGFGTVAGYAGLRSPVPGSIIGALVALVVLAAAVVSYRSAFEAIREFRSADAAGSGSWWTGRWATALAVGIVAVLFAVNYLSLDALLVCATLFAVSGWVVAWWSGRRPDPDAGSGAVEDDAADTPEIDPVGVGQRPSV